MLIFAADKVAELGPPVCTSQFGNGTIKLLLSPSDASYTIRNAAEQYLAARAPAGFYGNRFSTFSKGVALMRAARSINRRQQEAGSIAAAADTGAKEGGGVEGSGARGAADATRAVAKQAGDEAAAAGKAEVQTSLTASIASAEAQAAATYAEPDWWKARWNAAHATWQVLLASSAALTGATKHAKMPARQEEGQAERTARELDWATASFAYDCADTAPHRVRPVFRSHPGFELLRRVDNRGKLPCPLMRTT